MTTLKTLALSLTLVAAGGCALFDRQSPSQPQPPKTGLAPVTEVTHGVADPDYQLGRYYQGRNLHDQAIAAYGRAILANPANAEAHNGLGVIYANRGRYAEAEAEFKAAIALMPKAAHLHNNLGYCYLLQGRNEEALGRFLAAQALDPQNRRLAENIRLAEARRQALDPDKDAAGGPAPSVPPAPPASGMPAATSQTPQRSPGLVALAPNVYALPAPAQAPEERADAQRPVAAASLYPPAVPALQGLEVANGNGVGGMARRTAQYLVEHRISVQPRLTNQKPYTQPVTEIQYRPGHEQQARSLNTLLAQPGRLVASDRLRPAVAVRVVLGHDVARRNLFAEAPNAEMKLAKAD